MTQYLCVELANTVIIVSRPQSVTPTPRGGGEADQNTVWPEWFDPEQQGSEALLRWINDCGNGEPPARPEAPTTSQV